MARALEAVLGPDLPIAVRAYDGSRLGPADAPATVQAAGRSPKTDIAITVTKTSWK